MSWPKRSLTSLEAVQVQVQQRQFASAGAGAKQRLAELFVEGLAVAQAGQRVAVGHFQQLLLVGDLVADVADDAAVAPQFALQVVDQRNRGLEVAEAAVGALQGMAKVLPAPLCMARWKGWRARARSSSPSSS